MDNPSVFQVGGRYCETDEGAIYNVIEVLYDGTALLEGERHGNRVFAKVTGRTVRRVSPTARRVRIRFFAAEDIGLCKFTKLSETLKPNLNESFGGWAWVK